MIRAKLLAMCVCPAIAAPPAILAVSPPARHTVAHVLHHVAGRLDHRVPPVAALPAVVVASVPPPCPPAISLSALATRKLDISLSTNLGEVGKAKAFAGLSLDHSGDRAPPWSALAARYGQTSSSDLPALYVRKAFAKTSEDHVIAVQVAAVDLLAVDPNQLSPNRRLAK